MNEAGIGKLFSVMALFPFLTLRLPENLLAFGKFFTPGSQPKARPVSSNILLQGCGPLPQTNCLCVVSGETLRRREPLVRAARSAKCGAGLRPEAQVRERPGPLGGRWERVT